MRKTIALIEILGGILVLVSMLLLIFFYDAKDISTHTFGIPLISLVVGILFSGLNLFAGIQLWRNKNAGYIASMLSQLIQLLRIQTPLFHYLFYTIFAFIISFSKIGIMSFFAIGASYYVSIDSQPVTTAFVGINLIALILLLLILFLYKKRNKKQLSQEINHE